MTSAGIYKSHDIVTYVLLSTDFRLWPLMVLKYSLVSKVITLPKVSFFLIQ